MKNNATKPIRVLIVEDNAEIRKLTSGILNFYADIECIGAFDSAEAFFKVAETLKPDVVLMDIGLPGKSGIEAVWELKPKLRDTEFIMFTIHDDTDRIVEALSSGATGYVLKDSSPEKLAEAIRDVAAGNSNMTASVARVLVESMQQRQRNHQLIAKLTDQEQKVLYLLRDGLAYKEIAGELFIAIHTVRTHVRHTYEKLEVHTRTEAVNKAFGKK